MTQRTGDSVSWRGGAWKGSTLEWLVPHPGPLDQSSLLLENCPQAIHTSSAHWGKKGQQVWEFTSLQDGPQLLTAWLGTRKPSSLSCSRTTMRCNLHSRAPHGIKPKLELGLKVSLCLVVSPFLSCSSTPLRVSPRSPSLINYLQGA